MRRMQKMVSMVLLAAMMLFLVGQVDILAQGVKVVEKQEARLYLKGFSTKDMKIPYGLEKKGYEREEAGHYVVQFAGPIQDAWKGQLAKLGATIREYVPDFAFIVAMTDETKNQVQTLPYVTGILVYQPAFKLSRDLVDEHGVKTLKDGKSSGYFEIQTFDSNLNDLVIHVMNARGQIVEKGKDHVRVKLNRQYLATLAQLNNVKFIEEVPNYQLYNDIAKGYVDADDLWTLGYDGAGQIVGIADTGLDTGVNNSTMHQDFQGRINAIYALGRTTADDPHGHGTHVAGSVLGSGARSNGQIKGMAPAARLVFQSVLDSSGGLGGLPANMNTLFQQAYNDGARIHSNSWGASVNGDYNTDAQQVDEFVRNNRDMIILFAASNDGPTTGTIGSPGTAKNCITVGASENYRPSFGSYADNPSQIASFSSRGWCEDGRFKPDVVAPGTYILSTRSSKAPDSSFWANYNTYYAYMGGTSMATPITAGTVAVARQYIMSQWSHTPSAAMMKAVLINGATDLGFGYPSRDQGWGRVSLTDSLTARERNWVDETENISTGGSKTYTYSVESANTPLRITLVWTDAPGSTTATKALTNDLDLKVTAPDGTVYYGNDFTSPYNSAYDRINNVENVYINSPFTGSYTVEILGYNIPTGPQNFALVASGDFGIAPTDNIPPTVSLTAPVNGATLTGTTAITANASDNIGVTRVEFYAGSTYLGNDTTSPYSYSWNTTSVPNGTYNLTAKAFDGAGNNTTSSAVSVTVSNTITVTNVTELFKSNVSNTGTRSKYYYIDVTAAGTIDLSLTWDTTSDLDMFLYDPAGTEVARAYTTAKPETISYSATTTGTYKVKVDAYSGSGTFTLTATHPINANATGHYETTGTVNASGTKYIDYYVTVTTAGTLNVEVSWPGTADLDVYVYNPSGTEVVRGYTTYNPETVYYYPIATAGTYKIRVQAYSGTDTYTLKVNYPK